MSPLGAYTSVNTNLEYRSSTPPYSYERKTESYGSTLLDKITSRTKVKVIEENGRFTFSAVLINLVKDSLGDKEVDFERLKLRFEDVVFNSLSLLDDYIQENENIESYSITDKKFGINHVFSEMILSNIGIHPSAWAMIGNKLNQELINNLKIYGDLRLQSGKLTLINDSVYLINSTTYIPKEKDKSNLKIVEL